MKKWDLIVDELEIEKNMKEIRSLCDKRPYSNCEMIFQHKNKGQARKEIRYCIDGKNLTMLECINEVYFMHYYWGEVESVSVDIPDDIGDTAVVCDIVEVEGKERQGEVIKCLLNHNFVPYKKYYKWELTKDIFIKGEVGDLTYTMKYDSIVEATLYKVFDSLSDQLPGRSEFEQYYKDASLILAYDKNTFVGGVIFHVNGRAIVEDYIFTAEDARGKGYAGNIQNKFLQHCFEELYANKVYAWIEQRNTTSLAMHGKVGYVQKKENKSTFVWR